MAINRASFISLILFSLVPLSFASEYKPGVKEMKKYGPYGSILPQNYEFQLNDPGESFSEIYVRHDHMVDAVEFLVSKPNQNTYRVQFGGDGGDGSILPQKYEFQLNEGESFSEIHVRHKNMVDAIGFLVRKPDQSTYRVQFGGGGGDLTRIVLEDGEYLTRISGKYGYDKDRNYFVAIGTLTIHTNLHPEGYGPFGLAQDIAGNLFEFQSPKNVGDPIVGFFGRSNILLESIGIIIRKGLI